MIPFRWANDPFKEKKRLCIGFPTLSQGREPKNCFKQQWFMFSGLHRKVAVVFTLSKTIIYDFWTQSALTHTGLGEPPPVSLLSWSRGGLVINWEWIHQCIPNLYSWAIAITKPPLFWRNRLTGSVNFHCHNLSYHDWLSTACNIFLF